MRSIFRNIWYTLEDAQYDRDVKRAEQEEYSAWSNKKAHEERMKRFWDHIDFGVLQIIDIEKEEYEKEGVLIDHENWKFMIDAKAESKEKYLFYTRNQ